MLGLIIAVSLIIVFFVIPVIIFFIVKKKVENTVNDVNAKIN